VDRDDRARRHRRRLQPFDRDLEEPVAIKVLSPNLRRDENALLARFEREVALNRKIKHPNVARMYDYGIAGDYPFITMDLIDGKDLWTPAAQGWPRRRGRAPRRPRLRRPRPRACSRPWKTPCP